jgi:nucleobase:cation symporter-1, NCS1 family
MALTEAQGMERSSLYNADLAPTSAAHRTWGTYNYISLWFSMSMEVSTYMLASGLIAGGMNWKQAIVTILLGNLIVLIPLLLNAHAGAKYGIPFPVFVRAPFGVRGANVPAILRAIVACGWFGIQSWIGGQAIHSMLVILWPGAASVPWAVWACFLGFWALNMAVVWYGVESIRFLQGFSAPFMLVMSLALLIYALVKAGGFGPMLSEPSQFHSTGAFLHFFFPSLTAMVGYWATLALNIPDFTRYSKSQHSQAVGAGFWLAGGDDALFLHRRCRDLGIGRDLRPPNLESDRTVVALPSAAGGAAGHGRTAGGDAECECRGECGFTVE